MLEFLQNYFASGSFIPHGHCYLWKPELVWLHIISDSVIGLAYYSIPITLVYFVRKRQDLPFNWMFLLFGSFIVACGTTHIMEIWTLWHPTYWLSGSVKAITATVSLYTALELVPLVPKALALPSPAQLETSNQELRHQITERQRAELALQTAKEELEVKVAERTTELSNTNAQLLVEIAERKQAEAVLQQQTQLERVVVEISQRIRQSLNLKEILATTVSEVRQLLQTERVFIYRFEPDWSGVVVVESVEPGWSSLLGTKIKDNFFEASSNRELYKQGRMQAVEDIYRGNLSQCHIDLLAQLQIRANLVVPIVQSSSVSGLRSDPTTQNSTTYSLGNHLANQPHNSRLWGLLVANHCSEPRKWQQLEINLLRQLATQVAIAIQQSTLFEQVQTELAERKQAEAALRESEEKFRNLVEQTNDWIWKIDQTGVFTYVSPQVREIIGYEPTEIFGKTTFELMAADEVKRFAEVFETFTSVQKPFVRLEKTLTHKDGRLVVLEASGSPVFDRQRIFQGYRGIARDITERKQAEQAINKLNQDLARRAIELEATNRELEAFSYSVSHDLRAPLRAMNGFSRILINEYMPDDPEAKHYLQMIRDNAQQMGHLIDDLLAFSRLNRSPLKKQLVVPTHFIHQAIADLHHEQLNRQVEILINDLPPYQADPSLLKQVWINLLANALKFTRHQEMVRIEVGCQQVGNESIYFVRDNGVGFDMNYTDQLFGVFQRLHRAEEYEGTGVGLAIVQRIIHRHGGHVWAEAEVNKGAVFYFTLGEDNHNDRGSSRNSVSGRQPE